MSNRLVLEQRVLREIEASLSVLECLISKGNQNQVFYASAALTTGRRLYDAMQQYGVKSRNELDQIDPKIYKDLKQQNINDGLLFAEYIRAKEYPFVIAPGKFFMQGWLQEHYMSLWEQVIYRFADVVSFNEDWMSNGQVGELLIGLKYGRMLVGKDLKTLDLPAAIRGISDGINRILKIGADATALIEMHRDIVLFSKPVQTVIALS